MLKNHNESAGSKYTFRFCISHIVKVKAGNHFSDSLLVLAGHLNADKLKSALAGGFKKDITKSKIKERKKLLPFSGIRNKCVFDSVLECDHNCNSPCQRPEEYVEDASIY